MSEGGIKIERKFNNNIQVRVDLKFTSGIVGREKGVREGERETGFAKRKKQNTQKKLAYSLL